MARDGSRAEAGRASRTGAVRKPRHAATAAPSTDCAALFCPVVATITLLQQKWSLAIIHALTTGKLRFNELAATVGGVNSRTLRERLKMLEEEGLLTRRMVAIMPPWVEYQLTPKGEALSDVMDSIAAWGRKWMTPPRA